MNTIQKVTDKVYSVGIVDKDVRIFHGYQVPHGTTYNSYLIVGEKITLIDFVKAPFAKAFLENIKEVIGEKEIDYIVCNHVEPDHSGALPLIVENYPNAKIYGTGKCKTGLEAYYPEAALSNFVPVKKGDTLDIGDGLLHFIPMPMVHWPDSMATYYDKDKILFSNDALGEHLAVDSIWDEDLEHEFLIDSLANYFANIVLPFGKQVINLLKQLSIYDIKIACPSHGAVLRKHLPEALELYTKWSNQEVNDNKVVIVYDTMWGTTHKMAVEISNQWEKEGYNVELINLTDKHYSYAMGKLLDAKYIFVGSSTLNNDMVPSVIAFLTYMKGLKPIGRTGMAFGSYGWSGESIANIHNLLENAGFEMLEPKKVLWNC